MSEGIWFSFLLAAIPAGMPLLLGTLGEILTEKAGNINLGVEGMMYLGAIVGFLAGYYTNSAVLALLAAFAGGMLGALIYAFLTVTLKANQNVTGLTLTIFGTGLASLIGENLLSGKTTVAFWPLKAVRADTHPRPRDIPYVGRLFRQHLRDHRHRGCGSDGAVPEPHAARLNLRGSASLGRATRRGSTSRSTSTCNTAGAASAPGVLRLLCDPQGALCRTVFGGC